MNFCAHQAGKVIPTIFSTQSMPLSISLEAVAKMQVHCTWLLTSSNTNTLLRLSLMHYKKQVCMSLSPIKSEQCICSIFLLWNATWESMPQKWLSALVPKWKLEITWCQVSIDQDANHNYSENWWNNRVLRTNHLVRCVYCALFRKWPNQAKIS